MAACFHYSLTLTLIPIVLQDYGGVFRDAMTALIDDCFSHRIDLFTPTINNLLSNPHRNLTHVNQTAISSIASVESDLMHTDKWVPNPSTQVTSRRLSESLYEFVGQILGVAFRTDLLLPVLFPPFIWKFLVGEEYSIQDLEYINGHLYSLVVAVANWVPPSGVPLFLENKSSLELLAMNNFHARIWNANLAPIWYPTTPQLRVHEPYSTAQGHQPPALQLGPSSSSPYLASPYTGSHSLSLSLRKTPVFSAVHPTASPTRTALRGSSTPSPYLTPTDTEPPTETNVYTPEAEEAFAEQFPNLYFTTMSVTGHSVDLVPNGADMRVTLQNRWDWITKTCAYHLGTAYHSALVAMRRGLYQVAPPKAVRLLSWAELMILISGRPEVDIALLKNNTEYDGYRPSDLTIQLFWRALEEFTEEERSLFIRFIWGRSRLPISNRWTRKMKIQKRHCNEDQLPLSHTCFFSIELPPYSTYARMKNALLVAVHYGSSGITNA